MTCKTCGDKPKKDRHFPSAVVEINNPESLVLLRKVVVPASLGDDTDVPPAIGKYRNVILQYEANNHLYLYSSDGIPTKIDATVPQEVLDRITELEADLALETSLRQDADAGLGDRIDTVAGNLSNEVTARENADGVLQQEINDLKNSPDVVDIVATYADLIAYDTSSLGDKDVIRVLADETHEGQSDYYRWSTTTETWTFIGTVGNYYTKDQIDSLLGGKQDELTPGENVSIVDESGALVISANDTTYTAGYGLELNGTEFSVDSSVIQDTLVAGDNITIEDESGSLVISATDTTYNNFVGTDGTTAGQAGLVPAPATTDAGKVLGSNGNWVTGGPNVVQTTGTSTTDVMSQNATTGMIWRDYGTGNNRIAIGNPSQYGRGANGIAIATDSNSRADGDRSVAIGYKAEANMQDSITIATGNGRSYNNGSGGVVLGCNAASSNSGGIALGAYSLSNAQGEMNVGSSQTGYGYNNSNYRLISGVYDGQSAHDAATKGQLDSAVTGIESELDSKQDVLTAGDNITIADESGDLVISATDTTYTAGTGISINNGVISATSSGPTVVQTTGTSTTDVMSQNAVTSMVFADPSSRYRIRIGNNATVTQNNSVTLGNWISNYGVGGIAIGHSSSANGQGSIALGACTDTNGQGVMCIGPTDKSYGYNSSNYRLLKGLYDPQSAHDAATKGYVDTELSYKQDELTAGTGISIADESGALVISATGAQIATINAQDWSALWQ